MQRQEVAVLCSICDIVVCCTTMKAVCRKVQSAKEQSGNTVHCEMMCVTSPLMHRSTVKSLFSPTSRCILFVVENISFDASLVIYRVSQEEWTKLRESVPYVELYRYNPKHVYPKLNGYGDNGKRSLKL